MRNITLENITRAVIEHGDGGKSNPRLHEIYASLVRHLHAFVKETKLTDAELEASRQFLTRLAQPHQEMPNGEVHLMSDLLGVSELVQLLGDDDRGNATERNLEGPLYVPDAPWAEMGDKLGVDDKGEIMFVSGRVLDTNGKPAAGVILDVWQPNSQGYYDIQDPSQPKHNFRRRFKTGADGKYSFETVIPLGYGVPLSGPSGEMLHKLGRHGWRPAHIHYILSGEGFQTNTTMTYIEGARLLDSDTVFSVRTALLKPVKHDAEAEIKGRGLKAPFYTAEFDFVLRPGAQRRQAAE